MFKNVFVTFGLLLKNMVTNGKLYESNTICIRYSRIFVKKIVKVRIRISIKSGSVTPA